MSLPALATGAALAEITRKAQSKRIAETERPILLSEIFKFSVKVIFFRVHFKAFEYWRNLGTLRASRDHPPGDSEAFRAIRALPA
jgi:hypothetical protein